MLFFLQIIYVIGCILMVAVVLMQRSEGAGVAGMLGGGGAGESVFGTRTTSVLAKFTAGLGAFLLILTIVLSKMSSTGESLMQDAVAAPAPVKVEAAKDADADKAATPAEKVEGEAATATKAIETATKTISPAAKPADTAATAKATTAKAPVAVETKKTEKK